MSPGDGDGTVATFQISFKSIGKMMTIRMNDFKKLDLNLLVAFQVLVREKSVSRAAARLFLGQPAMSGALARLRDAVRAAGIRSRDAVADLSSRDARLGGSLADARAPRPGPAGRAAGADRG